MVECRIHGRRYVHVFPSDPFLAEIRDCYMSAARRIPWMSVDNFSYWNPNRPEWNDPELIVIFWGVLPDSIPKSRKAAVVLRYTESVGDPSGLNLVQHEIIDRFSSRAGHVDMLLGGNATVAEFWSGRYREVAFAPIGYEPEILGRPNWTAKKIYDVAFRGNYIGRRTWIINKLRRSFLKFSWIHDFGLNRSKQLDAAILDLYIGHSDEPSFPGMRLWQGIASSATLVTEPRNAWPAVAGRHYVEIPAADPDMFGLFVETIREILKDRESLQIISRRAHEELSVYTIENCMETYVVPATKGLRG